MGRSITREGTIRTDYNAPQITINWDPLTNGGLVTFNIHAYDFLNGEFLRQVPERIITLDIPQIIGRSVDIPTGKTIGGLDVMLFIKGLVSTLLDEAEAAESANEATG